MIVLPKAEFSAHIHDGWWGCKFLIVTALFIGSLYIDNQPFMIGYMQFARVVSVFFLAYQAIIILIVAYIINEAMVTAVSN